MGACYSKNQIDTVKRDKNHNRQKMFRLGVSFGRNDLNLEGNVQMGYSSKTNKKYDRIEYLSARDKLEIVSEEQPHVSGNEVQSDSS